MTNMVDAVGTTKYTYGNGLLASEDGPWSSDTVSLSYQNARERSQLVVIQPTGNAWTNSYGWDADHRLSTLTSPAGTLQERNSSGHPTVTYSRGRDLSGSFEGAGGIGGLLARTAHATSSPFQPSTHAYYHADGNGNVTYLTRGDGSSVGGYKFDPFGRLVASTGTLASGNLMRFSSKLWSQSSSGSTGLYYYGYRFYDPTSQRWMNRDPNGEVGFVRVGRGRESVLGDGQNLYLAFKNDALGMIDFYGLGAARCAKKCVKYHYEVAGFETPEDCASSYLGSVGLLDAGITMLGTAGGGLAQLFLAPAIAVPLAGGIAAGLSLGGTGQFMIFYSTCLECVERSNEWQ